MKWSHLAWSLGIVAVFVPVGLRVLTWSDEPVQAADAADISAGRVLFTHEFQPNDPLCNGSDGLGPVFNARSCQECHSQGGIGGGGDLKHNVTIFATRSRPVARVVNGGQQLLNLRREGVIHAFAVADEYRETLNLLDPTLPAISQPNLAELNVGQVVARGCQPAPLPSGVTLAQRNTPALFGAGLIDSIPDRVILANERRLKLRWGLAPGATEHLPVGRALHVASGRIGRFGWKSQNSSLGDFVQAACANELGLGNPNHKQPTPLGRPDYKAVGYDLTQKQCDQMTAFIAALPKPVERVPADPKERARARQGKAIFAQIGCAECHTPNLGSVDGIYSDLLLHRMGKDLESSGQSYGGEPLLPTEKPDSVSPLAEEWRTPPLWGVADSAPYLHDGRAATLQDAIRLHGGQGASASARFVALAPERQGQLISFLKTLRAPAAKEE
jgi:CxxC motif-containing protein (DUF1111 family)